MLALACAEGNACAQQCIVEAGELADPYAPSVELGAAPAARHEFFPADRVQHHGVFDLPPVFAGNGYGEVGYTPQEVGGPIQRVDDPAVLGVRIATAATFLAQKRVLRVSLAQVVDNFLLRRPVYFGNKVIGALGLHLDQVELVRGAGDNVTSLARCAQGGMAHGFHECSRVDLNGARL